MRTDGQRIEPSITDEQILRCFAVMAKLRRHLAESSRRLAFPKDAGVQRFEAHHFSQILS